MLRATRIGRSTPLTTTGPDFKERRLNIRKEIGMWLYKKESLQQFQQWCASVGVRARGKVKIVSTDTQARCLRTTKRIYPGEAIITAPPSSCVNFLTANREMFQTTHNFPIDINWRNWNLRLPYLKGAATHEMMLAAWVVRQGCRTGSSKFGPYSQWLMEDTTGRDGIASGISRERGDDNTKLDQLLQDLANDAGEEVDDYTEFLFRGFASVMKRASPIDTRLVAIQQKGTTVERLPADELFVPTLVPLVDCVPHDENGKHNCMLDYHLREELELETVRDELALTDRDTSPAVIGTEGLVSLRAIEFIDEGTYLAVRGWPKTDDHEHERSSQTILEQTIVRNNHLAS